MERRTQTSRRSRLFAVALMVLTLLVPITTLAAPSASAHSGKFEHADRAAADQECPGDSVPNGASVENLLGRLGPYIGCDHPGYSPIGGDVPLCEEARGRFIEGLCTFDRARPCGDDPAFVTEISDGMCLRLALVLDEFAPKADVFSRGLVPVCIESEFVQEGAPSGSVGAQFSQGSTDYLIVSGSDANCTFNCYDGWDINCDGKLGDYCASEYDLQTVADVGRCMASVDQSSGVS